MGQIAGDKHVTTGLSAAAFLFASMAQFMENYQWALKLGDSRWQMPDGYKCDVTGSRVLLVISLDT